MISSMNKPNKYDRSLYSHFWWVLSVEYFSFVNKIFLIKKQKVRIRNSSFVEKFLFQKIKINKDEYLVKQILFQSLKFKSLEFYWHKSCFCVDHLYEGDFMDVYVAYTSMMAENSL